MEILAEGFKGYWSENESGEAYHKDRTAVSSSALRKILKSPRSFQAHFQYPGESSKALRVGTLLHLALLEPRKFEETFVVMPTFQGIGMRSAKAAWLKDQVPGATVLTQSEMDDVLGMVESVKSDPFAAALLTEGRAEVSGYYRDPGTGIKCKIKPDFISKRHHALIDVKTCRSCVESSFREHVREFRYDFQIAMYMSGAEAIDIWAPNEALFLAIEKYPPYEIAVYRAKASMIERGKGDYRRALELLRNCLVKQEWPTYLGKDGLRELD